MTADERRQLMNIMTEREPFAEAAWTKFVNEVETARTQYTDIPERYRTGIAIAHVWNNLNHETIEAIGAWGCTIAIDASRGWLSDECPNCGGTNPHHCTNRWMHDA